MSPALAHIHPPTPKHELANPTTRACSHADKFTPDFCLRYVRSECPITNNHFFRTALLLALVPLALISSLIDIRV
jgi:hypothetical protein